MIHKKLEIATTAFGEWMSLTEIAQYLMVDTKINYLNTQRIGSILTSLGYAKDRKRRGHSIVMMYYVNKLNSL
jgi:CTP:phosphocholine cytidylyltransferase-like protein